MKPNPYESPQCAIERVDSGSRHPSALGVIIALPFAVVALYCFNVASETIAPDHSPSNTSAYVNAGAFFFLLSMWVYWLASAVEGLHVPRQRA